MARHSAPTYQRMGNMTAGFGRLTNAAGQERDRLASVLTSTIDDLYARTFRQASIDAEIKGAEYGAENPVTLKQIEDATKSGVDPMERFDTSTIFGRAAKETALTVFNNELTYQGRTTFALLDNDLRSQKADLREYFTQMNAVTAGLASAAEEASPQLGAKIRAELGVTAASYFQSYATEVRDKNEKQFKASSTISIADDMNHLTRDLTGFLKSLEGLDTDGSMVIQQITEFAKNKNESILAKAYAAEYTSSEINQLSKTLQQEMQTSLQEFIINQAQFTNDPGAFADAISKNEDTGNAVINGINNKLQLDQRRKVVAEIRQIERQLLQDEDAKQNRIDKQNEKDAKKLKGTILFKLSGAVSGNEVPEISEDIQRLLTLDPEKAADVMKVARESNFGRDISDPNRVSYLATEYAKGRLSYDDVLEAIPYLSPADTIDFTNKADALENDELKAAMRLVAGTMEYSPDALFLVEEGDPNFKKRAMYEKILGLATDALYQSKLDGTDFNAKDFVIAEMDKMPDEIEDAKNQLIINAGNSSLNVINTYQRNNNLPILTFDQAIEEIRKQQNNKKIFGKAADVMTGSYLPKLQRAKELTQ